MKYSISKILFASLVLFASSNVAFAQDDDGIYGDIFESPQVEESGNNDAPLDGYSTVDDYYPEGGFNQNQGNSNQPYSEQYVDENGNNVTNNYYGDYYEEEGDFAYSSRIRRFHRNNTWGYFDPWYTNMYYYTYDPFFWGTSINVGCWPNAGWGWRSNWGWNNGWNNWGWNNGWNNWGWNNSF